MQKPRIPENEAARLAALRALNLLDTGQEERFDRITRLAQRLFNVPIVLVSLVDQDRQWFKSLAGLSQRQTPRDISFCGHAILGETVFVVPDARRDDRFADNPLVTDEPYVRFYAGCPLRDMSGHKLGTLCLVDTKPRNMRGADVELLRDLANMVQGELSAVEMATMDDLTGISNRRGFKMLAEQAIRMCVRDSREYVLAFVDIDRFKVINDTYGHSEGDETLKVFADAMKRLSRSADIIGRLGGDEFAVFLADADREKAGIFFDRLNQELDSYMNKADKPYEISFSFGVVESRPGEDKSIDQMLLEGDRLMYESKRAKR